MLVSSDIPRTFGSFASLNAEVVATILEFVSIKPVVLFFTLRRTSKLFNQAVALAFERRYFQKYEQRIGSCGEPDQRTVMLEGWDGCYELTSCYHDTVSIGFSNSDAVIRSFLVMSSLMRTTCLHAVETLTLPPSPLAEDLRKLLRVFPNVKHLCCDEGIAESTSAEEVADIILSIPKLETLQLTDADGMEPNILSTLLSKLNATVFRRLHLTGWVSLSYDSSYAAVFASLSWLHIESMEFKDDGEFICSRFPNLEGLELVNLSLTGDFFKIWNANASARKARRSLVALDLTENRFSDPPKSADVDEFFQYNPRLQSLTLQQGWSFPTSWLTSVAKHCKDLRFVDFPDWDLPMTEYDAMANDLQRLQCVHLDLLANDLCEERMTRVSRLKNLQLLRIMSPFGPSPLFSSDVAFPNLRFLGVQVDTPNMHSILSVIEGAPQLRFISCGNWDDELVAAVADHCPLLLSLDIKGVASSAPLDLTPIFQRCKILRTVSLVGARYSENLFERIAHHCRQLRRLSLNGMGIGFERKIRELLTHPPAAMSELVLCSLTRNRETMEIVFKSLCNSPHLDMTMIKCDNSNNDLLSCWKPQLLKIFPELSICS